MKAAWKHQDQKTGKLIPKLDYIQPLNKNRQHSLTDDFPHCLDLQRLYSVFGKEHR
jgi:hypothetical protein